MRAIKAAGDLVVGRRLRIMYRVVWGVLMAAIMWACVMIPLVLIDTGIMNLLPAIKDVPIVPIVATFTSALTAIWISGYIYILYRRIVDDSTTPA